MHFLSQILGSVLDHLGTLPMFLVPGLLTSGQTAKAGDITGLATIFTSATGTLSLTTNANQKVICFAKGNRVHTSNTGNGSDVNVYLKYNAVTKDSLHYGIYSGSGGNFAIPFALMYTETPGAGTHDITVTGDETLENMIIIAILIDPVGT